MKFTVVVDMAAAQRQLDGVLKRLSSFKPLFVDGFDALARQMAEEQFASGGALGRAVWPPNAPKTMAWKARQGRPLPMRVSDRLYNALTRASHPDRVVTVTDDRYSLELLTPYARFHQFGTRNLPIRQVIPDPVPASYLDRFAQLVRAYVATGATSL